MRTGWPAESEELITRHFEVRISLNSTTELEYHLICVKDLALLDDSGVLSLLTQVIEVRKMVYGLLAHLTTRSDANAGG
jgi:four helix bundle protein